MTLQSAHRFAHAAPSHERYLLQKRGRVQRIIGFIRRLRLQLPKKQLLASSPTSSRSQSPHRASPILIPSFHLAATLHRIVGDLHNGPAERKFQVPLDLCRGCTRRARRRGGRGGRGNVPTKGNLGPSGSGHTAPTDKPAPHGG